MVTHILYPFQIFSDLQNANKRVWVHRPKSLVEVNQAITRLISIESQPKKVVVVVFVVVVKLQTQSEGLGVDFTFPMEQEEQQEEQQEQASPKFLGWDGTRGLKFGNLT